MCTGSGFVIMIGIRKFRLAVFLGNSRGSIPPVNSMEVTLCEQMRMLEKHKQIRENGLYMYSERDALQHLHCD